MSALSIIATVLPRGNKRKNLNQAWKVSERETQKAPLH